MDELDYIYKGFRISIIKATSDAFWWTVSNQKSLGIIGDNFETNGEPFYSCIFQAETYVDNDLGENFVWFPLCPELHSSLLSIAKSENLSVEELVHNILCSFMETTSI